MKIYRYYFYILLLVSNVACAKSSSSYGNRICADLARQLDSEFFPENNGALPTKWEDFTEVRYVQEGRIVPDPGRMQFINSLALLPQITITDENDGIPKRFRGWGLLAVSRLEVFDNVSATGGRYVILVELPKEGFAERRVINHFIPEDAARPLIKKIAGANLSDLPLAFDPKLIGSVEKQETENKVSIRDFYRSESVRQNKANLKNTGYRDIRQYKWYAWFMLGIVFFGGLVYFIRRTTRNAGD